MKKWRGLLLSIFLCLAFGAGVWWFIGGVREELWQSSIRTISESSHQGANALNTQLEKDFETLQRIWDNIEYVEKNLTVYEKMEPDVELYLPGKAGMEAEYGQDDEVAGFLSGQTGSRGIINSHISSVTGENVFNIYVRGFLEEGDLAYLVKEYRAKEIADQFTITFYDNNGFSYLVNRDGEIMVRSGHRNSNKTVSNLMDIIDTGENDAKAIEEFRRSIGSAHTGWARFNYGGKGMVLCFEPLEADSNWLLVSIIPEPLVREQAMQILKKTLLFSGTAVGLILLIVVLFYGAKMRENEVHTRELQEALNAADMANRAKGRFLMNMSHDIRTPLNAILGMTTVARKNAENQGKVQDSLKKIETSGMELLTLVSDVMDMTEIEQGQMILKEEKVRLSALLKELVDMMRGKAKEASLTLECEPVLLENDFVIGDAMRIRQILLNIIGNAVKYTPAGGSVYLSLKQAERTEKDRGDYTFCCADTGIGMEPDFLKRVFLPFERARNTTASKIAGTGVGLAVTKYLLDLMGGEISVESMPGMGSTFSVNFHFKLCQEAPAEVKAAEADKPQTEEKPQKDPKSEHVLLVDDNELNMEIMEELLGLAEIYPDKAFDGSEAVKAVQESPDGYYDLIFMDIQMPVMDGCEATRQIRSMEREDAKKIPIYAVSANAFAEDVKNAMDSGMNGHIAKPVDWESIDKVLNQYLR